VVIAGLVLLFTKTGIADPIQPLDPVSPGCKPTPIGVRITGTTDIADSAWLGVIPEIQEVNVDDIKTYNALLGIFSEDFTWKVQLIDPSNGKVIAEDSGKGNQPGGDVVVSPTYLLDFKLSDNNCNGILDEDFDAKLVATIKSSEGTESRFKYIQFRSGSVTVSDTQ